LSSSALAVNVTAAPLDAEHENLRQALDWCLTRPAAAADGLRLAVALWLFWLLHGFLSEGRAWLERALAANSVDAPAAARARGLAYAGHAAWLQGDAARAIALSEEGLAFCQCAGQEQSEAAAYCLRNLVAAALARGDYARAHDLAEECVAVAQTMDDRRGLAHALFERGRVAFFQGELGLRRHAAFSLTDLALAACLVGNFAEAQRLYAESLAIFRETGDRHNLMWALEGEAGLLAAIGQAAPATKLLGAAAALRTAAGLPVPPVERQRVATSVAAARRSLGESGFATAWGDGQRMTAEHAIAQAQQELDLASARTG
jgi:tetratricopeptide (TPR) repeat protein